METPVGCAEEIASFLNEKFAEYDEKEPGKGKEYRAYAGFLPVRSNTKEMRENCPFIAVRPVQVVDSKEESLARMAVFVTTFDEDPMRGCGLLYHILEFIRLRLLEGNPVRMKYQIRLEGDGTMETYVPDEQPWPYWQGRIDFAVHIEQPRDNRLARKNSWGRG